MFIQLGWLCSIGTLAVQCVKSHKNDSQNTKFGNMISESTFKTHKHIRQVIRINLFIQLGSLYSTGTLPVQSEIT